MDTHQRDHVIAEAVRQRKIREDQADKYRQMYDANPSAIHHLLTASVAEGGFTPGLVTDGSAVPTEYPPEWLGPSTTGTAVVMSDDGLQIAEAAQPAADGLAQMVTFEP